MIRKLFLLLLFTGVVGMETAVAQGIDFGLTLDGGFPQGSFKENVENNGLGIEGTFAYNIPRSPLTLGLDLGFITYGNDTRRESFNPNIPEVQVRVRTTNNIFTGHFFIRIESKEGGFRPYVDGLIGLNYLFTESQVGDDDDTNTIATTTNFDDTAFSYGVGGGLKFKIADYIDKEGDHLQWFIDLRARYLFGGEAEYLREGSLRDQNGNLVYDSDFSNTDLVTVGVGFVLNFN